MPRFLTQLLDSLGSAWRQGSPRERAVRDGLVALGVIFALFDIAGVVSAVDTRTYWIAGSDLHAIYPQTWDPASAKYVYPPPLAVLFAGFHLFPWPIFLIAWTALVFGALWYVARFLAIPLVILGMAYFAFPEQLPIAAQMALGWVMLGNVQILIAAVTIAGFRWPALWALPILTKVGPGVGLVWFAVRREWRSLAIAIGSTAIVAAVSFVVAPWTWFDWFAFLQRNAATPSFVPVVPVPFPVRLAIGAALVAWGARTGRRWTVPIAVGISSPQLYEWSFLVIWLAAIPLWRADRQDRGVPTRGSAGASQPLETARGST